MARGHLRAGLVALALLMQAGALRAATTASSAAIETEAPDGFDGLTRPREVIADVYFGGRKLGEAVTTARPGFLRFQDPAKIAALIPNAADPDQLLAAISGDLPTNSNLVCAEGRSNDCGQLEPASAGIIFDEDHFRIDLFLAPAMLRIVAPEDRVYLPTPAAALSLTAQAALRFPDRAARPLPIISRTAPRSAFAMRGSGATAHTLRTLACWSTIWLPRSTGRICAIQADYSGRRASI